MQRGNRKPTDERALMRQWVRRWQRAGKALEEVRRQELRDLDRDPARRRAAIATVLALPARFRRIRRTSGLVEQQSLFSLLLGKP
jgi:hypothetical protein